MVIIGPMWFFRALSIHKLWELALDESNHKALVDGENMKLIEAIINNIANFPPNIDSSRMNVMTCVHFTSVGAVGALLSNKTTIEILLNHQSTQSILVESLFIALKRIPKNALLQSIICPNDFVHFGHWNPANLQQS